MFVLRLSIFSIKFIILFFTVGFFFLALTSFAQAATIYVNSSTGNDSTGDGSVGAPYKTFHKAYTSASSEDIIDLTGTFTWSDADETGDVTTNGYSLSKNLTIQGQGADSTIIQSATASTTADRKVLTINSGYSVTLRDLSIRNGRVTSSTSGGGVNNAGTTTIERVYIYDNYTGGTGGGIANTGFLYVKDSTISNNYATSQGGGINNAYILAANNVSVIINSTISHNRQAASVATVGGAGIFVRTGNVIIINSTVAYNDNINGGTSRGVGLQTDGGTASIANSLFILNKVQGNNVVAVTSQYFDIYQSSGTITDAGGNIFGKTYNITYDNSSWYDNKAGSGVGDSIFTNQGTNATGTVSLDSSLTQNNSLNKTPTLAITNGTSLTVNNGDETGISSYSIPSTDQRGASRSGANDVGAYEYSDSFTDETAPIISSIATSTATSTATISWSTNETATSTLYYGLTSSYGSSETNNSGVTSHSYDLSGLTPNTTYYFQIETADSSGNISTSSDLFLTDALPDESGPTFSDISTSTTGSSATISWQTNEESTSVLVYSPGPIYRFSTSTNSATTSHQFTISDLPSCTTFNFKLAGVDSLDNSATSSAYSFVTSGCTGDTQVSGYQADELSVAEGGTLSLENISLTVPALFTSGVASTTFQINKLNRDTFLTATGIPSGKSRSSIPVFNLKSLSTATTTISDFDEDIEIVFDYEDSEVEGLSESSLWAYRWDGASWNPLTGCVVDSNTNSVTCTTDQFSDFTLFGEANSEVGSTSATISTGNTIESRIRNLISMGSIDEAWKLGEEWQSLISQKQDIYIYLLTSYLNHLTKQIYNQNNLKLIQDLSVKFNFKQDLQRGDSGDGVKELQRFLIEKNIGPDAKSLSEAGITGYFGSLTKDALIEYQIKENIKPVSGYFGPLTRKNILNKD